MKRIIRIIILTAIILFIPVQLMGADYFTGNGYKGVENEFWGVTSDRLVKITDPGTVYDIKDITSYSAYATNAPRLIGNDIAQSFSWFNKSRLLYAKLLKVQGGQEISFYFAKSYYVYCAQYNSSFKLIDDGVWATTGDKVTMRQDAQWIVIVFRKVNGDLSNAAGLDTEITPAELDASGYKYIVFKPFTYTFNLNGGTYKNYKDVFTMERLGVAVMDLPIPQKSGYAFKGWKAEDESLYSGALDTTYRPALFKNTGLTAQWEEIVASGVSLNETSYVLEQNSDDVLQLTAEVAPADTMNKSITWSSSDPNIAQVDSNGSVIPGNSGIATITATAANGKSASCTVYVMGFEIMVPDYCNVLEAYEIKINVYNNGIKGTNGRKRVVLDTQDSIDIVRKDDVQTSYLVLAEASVDYGKNYNQIADSEFFVETEESTTVYYRLRPDVDIKKAGDYEGSVTFTVSVR